VAAGALSWAPIDADEMALFAKSDAILLGYKRDATSDATIVRASTNRFAEGMEAITPKAQ